MWKYISQFCTLQPVFRSIDHTTFIPRRRRSSMTTYLRFDQTKIRHLFWLLFLISFFYLTENYSKPRQTYRWRFPKPHWATTWSIDLKTAVNCEILNFEPSVVGNEKPDLLSFLEKGLTVVKVSAPVFWRSVTSTIYTIIYCKSDLVGLARLVTKADFECGPHRFRRKERRRSITPHQIARVSILPHILSLSLMKKHSWLEARSGIRKLGWAVAKWSLVSLDEDSKKSEAAVPPAIQGHQICMQLRWSKGMATTNGADACRTWGVITSQWRRVICQKEKQKGTLKA